MANRRNRFAADWGDPLHKRRIRRTWSTPPDRNTAEYLSYFTKSPRLAVVDRIASDLSHADGKLYEVDKRGEEREVTQHAFLDFMDQPNPLYELSAAALWRLFSIYLDLKGEGYFIIERDMFGRPCELWPVPPHWVTMTPYEGYPFFMVTTSSSGVLQVGVDDMFFMKEIDPLDPYKRGKGRAEAVADEIEIDEYAAKFQKNFFYNDATPATIITMPDSTEEQRRRFVNKWRERFRGIMNRSGIAAVDGNMTVQKLSENMKDMDMIQGRVFTRDAVLEHYSVPREIMGITENSNRATADAAQYIYAANVLTPRLLAREEAINTQLLPVFGDNLYWRFDPIVPDDSAFKLQVANEGLSRGAILINEWREANGFEPLPNGDVLLAPMSVVAIEPETRIADVLSVGAMAPMPLDEGWKDADVLPVNDEGMIPIVSGEGEASHHKSTPSKNPGVKSRDGPQDYKASAREQAGFRTMDAAQAQTRRQLSGALNRAFTAQGQRLDEALTDEALEALWDELDPLVEVALTKVAGDIDQAAAMLKPDIDRIVTKLIRWDKEADHMLGELIPAWLAGYDKNAEAAKSTILSKAVVALDDVASLKGGERIAQMLETTKTRIADQITGAALDKVPRDTLRQEVHGIVVDKERLKAIADDEAGMISAKAEFDTYKASGMRVKRWVTRGDGKVRRSHRRVNGEVVDIDRPFSNGLMYPRDANGPLSERIECRCRIVVAKS